MVRKEVALLHRTTSHSRNRQRSPAVEDGQCWHHRYGSEAVKYISHCNYPIHFNKEQQRHTPHTLVFLFVHDRKTNVNFYVNSDCCLIPAIRTNELLYPSKTSLDFPNIVTALVQTKL
ncbi:hypothetical protein NPIL_614251 [Nephila pilipes]|uniref:Uncharacterized protein n=1 Tax=Nephila pilipes TaxID=299642 RepID=A0A8X6TGU0_NEPPI|nr:hypothetical protein NPIL_93751 [Nephila pilipes]GFU18939.1 hypothetical protein NPIL_614251 [Nephila pilipes]